MRNCTCTKWNGIHLQLRPGLGSEQSPLAGGLLGKPRLYLYTPGSGALYPRLGWCVAERTFYRELWGEQETTIMEFAIHAP